MYMYFPPFSLENKLLGIHQTSFLPIEAREFSELKTPLVYIFHFDLYGSTPPICTAVLLEKDCQEDVNGAKLTVKKWWIFGADLFTVWCRFFTFYKGHKR